MLDVANRSIDRLLYCQFLDEGCSFSAYGWLYIILIIMDPALAHCVRAFDGCGRGRDPQIFAALAPLLNSHFAADAYVKW